MNYKHLYTTTFLLLFGISSSFAQDTIGLRINYDLRTIEEKYPSIFTYNHPKHPDTAYEIGFKTDGFIHNFIGDEGKSLFYLAYAKHLQRINNFELSQNYRSNFIQLFQSINHINQLIDTKIGYFESMQTKLIAYAEFALYDLKDADQTKLSTVDVNKQKKLFIKSIEQKVKTKNIELKLSSLPNYAKNQEILKQEILNVERLITDAYALKSAQIFHYTYF